MHSFRTLYVGLFAALVSLSACRSSNDPPRRRPTPVDAPRPSVQTPVAYPDVQPDVEVVEEENPDAGPPVVGCIHEHGGCRRRPRALTPCAADIGAMAVGDVITNRARMVRQRVSVFGRLALQSAVGSCTERGCPPTNRCCNACTTEMVVAGGAEPNAPKLLLSDPENARAFTCVGDVSEMCCPLTETANVVVQGTVVAPGAGRTLLTLQNPTICEIVRPRVAPAPVADDASVSQ